MIREAEVVHNLGMDNRTICSAGQQADCALVCHAYVAFGRRDLRDLFHLLSPDASMALQLGPLWPDAVGRDAVLDCLVGIIKGTDGSAMAERIEIWSGPEGQILSVHVESARWRGQVFNERIAIQWCIADHRITAINRMTPLSCAP